MEQKNTGKIQAKYRYHTGLIQTHTGTYTHVCMCLYIAQDRFKINAEFRQNTDKIQTSYMQIQTCMYELVSIPRIQT